MKTIIIDIAPKNVPKEDLENRMAELESLVSTYGGIVVIERVQKRDTPDYHTYIGSGKLEEIITQGEELGAELIIVGNILKPAQIYHINEILEKRKSKIKAWDRVDLILKIFDQHAVSPESRLQIELASIHHMGPRIFGMGMELSRQWGGGSGAMRGLGETNTEIMKRHLAEREHKIMERLERYEKTRAEHRKSRRRKEFKTVGIVGYTNAGKSTLMNALTNKWVLAEDKLFATLGTNVGKMWIAPKTSSDESVYAYGQEILVNDTIGFIRDLPPGLIRAFASTLEDSIESDILLHVIDASDPRIEEKIEIVEDTLASIHADQERIYVFNKIDSLSLLQLDYLRTTFSDLNPVFVSAFEHRGLDILKERIMESLSIK